MPDGSDAEILLRLLGARPEDLVAKRQSEIIAQNPGAFAGDSSLLAGLGARNRQSARENAELPRRQAVTRADMASTPLPDAGIIPQNPLVRILGEALFASGAIPANVAAAETPNDLIGLIRDLNPFSLDQRLASGEFEQFDPALMGQDLTGNPITGTIFDLAAPGPDIAMLPFGRAARGNRVAEDIVNRAAQRMNQGLPHDINTFQEDLAALMGQNRVFVTGREHLKFGNDTEMTVTLGMLPNSDHPVLHINALNTNNPNIMGGGLKLTPEQRQILTFFDLADANDIPITTSASAFGHANLTTPELEYMYNRLGFEPDPDEPGLLVRWPVSLDWAARRAELSDRRLPSLEEPALRMREVKRRIANGDAPTISESFLERAPDPPPDPDYDNMFQSMTERAPGEPIPTRREGIRANLNPNYYARSLARHINHFVGERQGRRLTPDELDEISKFIGNAVGEARKTGKLVDARQAIANRLGVTERVAWDLIFEYSRMVGFD